MASSSPNTGVGSSNIDDIEILSTETRKADVWEHFDRIKNKEGVTKAQCKKCQRLL